MPLQDLWTLTAPDGRTWQADSPLKCAGKEQRERVPDDVALERVLAEVSQPALEQGREQEPVAWMHINEDGNIRMWSKSSRESIEAAIGCKPIPLYPSPPARQWVGLSDGEWVNIINNEAFLQLSHSCEDAVRLAVKLVEAKLKALNQ